MARRSWTDEQLLREFVTNNSIAGILKNLGLKTFRGNYQTIRKHMDRLGLDYEEIKSRSKTRTSNNLYRKTKTEDILVKDSTYSRGHLRGRIFKENLLKYECQVCGVGDKWQGKEIVLQLDHINGEWRDNRIENLRFLCPNCHSQTKNWSGRNSKKIDKKCFCGKSICKKSTFCHSCAAKRQKTKINWPPIEKLLEMVENEPFTTVAKKLGVTDNAIRKRIKNHMND